MAATAEETILIVQGIAHGSSVRLAICLKAHLATQNGSPTKHFPVYMTHFQITSLPPLSSAATASASAIFLAYTRALLLYGVADPVRVI